MNRLIVGGYLVIAGSALLVVLVAFIASRFD